MTTSPSHIALKHTHNKAENGNQCAADTDTHITRVLDADMYRGHPVRLVMGRSSSRKRVHVQTAAWTGLPGLRGTAGGLDGQRHCMQCQPPVMQQQRHTDRLQQAHCRQNCRQNFTDCSKHTAGRTALDLTAVPLLCCDLLRV